MKFTTCMTLLGVVSIAGTALAADDLVLQWNSEYQDAIRITGGGGPGPIGRSGAMLHGAIYDAVNSISRTHNPYSSFFATPTGTSRDAAISCAANEIMKHAFPTLSPRWQTKMDNDLLAIPDGAAKTAGIALGQTVANHFIAMRAADGSAAGGSYTPGTEPGAWRPTYPDFSPAVTPHWGNVTPWTMATGSQFRPPAPPSLTSVEYANNVNEVQDLGSLTSSSRTPYQTETAFFWANDVNGTYKPPGHLNNITQTISRDRSLSVEENARLFALLNLGLADAGVVAWDAKYNTDVDLWRPITAIREADTDGNDLTIKDESWEPLAPFTPAFPAYTSGHATFGATHAAVLKAFFGTDAITFTIDSEDPLYTGGLRTYSSLYAAAEENAISRVYLGVHYRFDATFGLSSGTALGDYVGANFLLPIPAPSTMLLLGAGMVAAGRRRR